MRLNHVLPVALLALTTAVAPVRAQQAGHYVGPLNTSIVSIDPSSGAMSTLVTLPFQMAALTMAPGNVDFAVLGRSGTNAFVAHVSPGGTVTTIQPLPTSYIFENMAFDQDGSYLVPIGAGKIQIGRVTPLNVSVIDPSPSIGGGKPRGIAVDITSGGYMVGEIPTVYHVARNGNSNVVNTMISINNGIDMWSDPRTGGTVISQQNNLISVDPLTGTQTTINATPFSGCFPGLAYDRARDAFVLAGSCSRTNAWVYRVARNGAVTTVGANAGLADLEVYGSRNVSAIADPVPGSTFVMTLSDPSAPSAGYFAAASFSTGPGIPLAIGTVDLAPDALFFLSGAAPTIFQNFTGALDSSGSATAAIRIPGASALQGVRFFVSFVTFTGATLQTIANTQGFTIQ